MANKEIADLAVTSNAFKHEGTIPARYTCNGEAINPPLTIDHIPEATKTMAIIVEDPDAPSGTFDHWLVWNIQPTTSIRENTIPGTSGTNSAGKTGYHPPCPPSGSHRYYFHVFALDAVLDLETGADRKTLQQAMQPHIIAWGALMGRYQQKA